MGLFGHPSKIHQVEGFRQPLSHWAGSLLVENLCISIPGKRDMMMTPMDFYASITPDCNKFGVSGQAAPCYRPGFQWKFIEHWIDQTSNKKSISQAMAGVHVTVPEAEVAAGRLESFFYKYSHLYRTHHFNIELIEIDFQYDHPSISFLILWPCLTFVDVVAIFIWLCDLLSPLILPHFYFTIMAFKRLDLIKNVTLSFVICPGTYYWGKSAVKDSLLNK